MHLPTTHAPPIEPADRAHLRLAERGVALLPEAVRSHARVTLTDAMLAVAALAGCFGLARAESVLGLVAVALPALARTHAVMVRARDLGRSPGAGAWLAAFASSAIRVGLILGLVAVIEAASLAVGGSLARRFNGPLFAYRLIGPALGGLLLGLPTAFLFLAYLVPRLLSVRDPI